jgi:Predicted thioesterase involved in non-ribosomal peptide biosynthesis
MKEVRLYCLSCAGGTGALYKDWEELGIEVYPVEYAGHGSRFQEPLYCSVDEAVEDIFLQIDTSCPYALFGHSMGSILCYELIIHLQKEHCPLPEHVFFSASNPPEVMLYNKYDTMSDSILLEKLYQMGGMERDIIENSKLMEIFLPIIRSDFNLLSSYKCNKEWPLVECDISILFGKDDFATMWHDLRLWYKYTMKNCRFKAFSGGHFYLHENKQLLFTYIRTQFEK